MQITLPHTFTKAEARRRVEQALNEARPKMAEHATVEEERWSDDTLHFAFTAQGQHISGTFTVGDNAYELDAKLPLMMRMFEGKIKTAIEEQAKAMLG